MIKCNICLQLLHNNFCYNCDKYQEKKIYNECPTCNTDKVYLSSVLNYCKKCCIYF